MAPAPHAPGTPEDAAASVKEPPVRVPRALRPSPRFVGLVLVAMAILSRAVVVPDGPWEQDEAIFAAGVIDLDVVAHRPHPPGFPGWMLIGKLLHVLGLGALDGLRLASALSSVALGWIVVELLRRRVGRGVALASAAALLATPLVWVHAARGFTSTAGTACVGMAALAWGWRLRPAGTSAATPARTGQVYAGWLVLGFAASIRPQLAPTLLVLAVARMWTQRRDPRHDLLAAAGGATFVVCAYL